MCGGCEDKDIYFQWYPREGFALQIPQLPQTFAIRQTTDIYQSFFCCVCCSCASTRYRTLNKSNAQMRVSNRGKLQHCSLCAGVARIKIFIFNGILARASPFESLNSHKRSEAKRCRIFDTFCFWILCGANSVCRHKCPKTKSVDLSTFCVAKFVRAPAASGKGTTSDKRVNSSTHKHSLVAREWRILCRRRESQA